MKHTTLALAALIASSTARADLVAARCDTDRGSHLDVLTSTYSDGCLGHVERNQAGVFVRTVALPEPMSGDVRASRDLRSVVYVASYMSATADEALARNPVVIRVYRDGALVKEHRLLGVATKADLRSSISHVRFASNVGSVDGDGRLTITNHASGSRTIDAHTGALQKTQ